MAHAFGCRDGGEDHDMRCTEIVEKTYSVLDFKTDSLFLEIAPDCRVDPLDL